MMLFFEYMTTCPKCKVLWADLIKVHFLGGSFTKPLTMYFSPIDGVHRDNMFELALPIVPLVYHEPRYVNFVPVVHGNGVAVSFPQMVKRSRELFTVGSLAMRALLKRLGEERYPPAPSRLNERYGAEVLERMREQFGI